LGHRSGSLPLVRGTLLFVSDLARNRRSEPRRADGDVQFA
jgi:hypothetical protein